MIEARIELLFVQFTIGRYLTDLTKVGIQSLFMIIYD